MLRYLCSVICLLSQLLVCLDFLSEMLFLLRVRFSSLLSWLEEEEEEEGPRVRMIPRTRMTAETDRRLMIGNNSEEEGEFCEGEPGLISPPSLTSNLFKVVSSPSLLLSSTRRSSRSPGTFSISAWVTLTQQESSVIIIKIYLYLQ